MWGVLVEGGSGFVLMSCLIPLWNKRSSTLVRAVSLARVLYWGGVVVVVVVGGRVSWIVR
jgi:hypothetical protein